MSEIQASQWWDEAGAYPTDDALARLKQLGDPTEALDFVRELWNKTYGRDSALRSCEAEVVHAEGDEQFVRLATGGWSGNEHIIAAFHANIIAWTFTWRLSSAGGLHIFRYPRNG